MARRSPLNARYQKDTGPAGKTRRSASSAKPKREAGESGSPAPRKKKSSTRPTLREAFAGQPSTPEMKKWRTLWWVLIVVAFVLAIVAALVPYFREQPALRLGLMVAYVIALGAALYIDFSIIRKLRAKAVADGKAADKKR